jgi:Ni/Co efflux regulator RcnB
MTATNKTKNLKMIVFAAALAVVMASSFAVPAKADPGDRGRGRDWHDERERGRGEERDWREHEARAYRYHRVHTYYEPGVVYAPPPVVYAPPPPSGISLFFPLHID